jgi:hypothetical protein
MATAKRAARASIILAASAAATLCVWGASQLTAAPADRSEIAAPRGVVRPTKPTAEIIENSSESISLLFRCEPHARTGELSVLVRVADTGAIEMEVGSVEPAPLRADDRITMSEPAIMRDLRVVRVTFMPGGLGADPDAYASSLELTIRASKQPGTNEKHRHLPYVSPAFRRIYRSTVLNYDDEADAALLRRAVSQRGDRELPFGGRYLVITWGSFEETVRPLVEWKHAKGMQAKLATLAETGSTVEDIRAYIETAYNTWTVPPEFVLLVGDTEQVPVYYGLTHTDNYYAAIDGSDYLADVMVGRLSADTPGECATEVAKILGYERTPLEEDPNWPTSATLMIADDFDDGDWVYYDNTWFIYDLMDAAGFAPIDTLFRRNPVTIGDVYASINAGKGFLNFRGQAFFNWNPPFNIDPELTESGWRLPVVVSATCGTGVYDNDGYVCEEWVRAGTAEDPAGGVAFFGSNTIIAASVPLSLRRGYVNVGFMTDAFGENGLTLGEACLAGKLNLYQNDENEQEYQAWNLLGDPELNLWTAAPAGLSVLYDEAVPAGSSNFAVTVLKDGAVLEGALTACVKGEEVYAWGYTDESGAVMLPISPSTAGTLAVTVTARNAVPHEGSVLVVEGGPFASYSGIAIDDSTGGNGDGLLSPGESAEVWIELCNMGDEAAPGLAAVFRTSATEVSVADSTSFYGDLPPDSTAWGQDPFSLTVSPDVPEWYVLSYSLALAYGGTVRVISPPPIELAEGRLFFSSAAVEDGAPGGNGDGAPGTGETIGLTVTLVNDGECDLTSVEGTLTTTDPYVAVTSGGAAFTDADAGSFCGDQNLPFLLSISPAAPHGHVAPLSLAMTAAGHSYSYSKVVDFDIVISGTSPAMPTGPDAYGYYAYDQSDSAYGQAPVFDWYDIAPPGPGVIIEEITDADAAISTIGTFFNFGYYGIDYDQISICSNGFVVIAPFWDDLDPSAGGDIYKWFDVSNHRWIIQFDEVLHWDSTDSETFQVIIMDPTYHPTPTGDGPILIQYESVTAPGQCTVGIEDLLQTDGLEYLCNGSYGTGAAPIATGSAILFTTEPPSDPAVPWLVLGDVVFDDAPGGNGDGKPQPGETVTLALEFSNNGVAGAEDVTVLLSSGETMLSVVDSTAAVPNIPAGGAGSNSDPLAFVVSETISDTVATLWAQVTANGGTYAGTGRIDIHIDLTSTGIEDDPVASVFNLRPGYPNPFAADTRLQLTLPAAERVVARVYSPAGRLVKTLVDTQLPAGEHFVPWDGTDERGNRVGSGVYFVLAEAGADRALRKVVLLR